LGAQLTVNVVASFANPTEPAKAIKKLKRNLALTEILTETIRSFHNATPSGNN